MRWFLVHVFSVHIDKLAWIRLMILVGISQQRGHTRQ
jgi:hypothetical protein